MTLEELGRLIHVNKPQLEQALAARPGTSYFEAFTALAIRHFSDSTVDWAILEAGMGGVADATNVFRAHQVSLPIALVLFASNRCSRMSLLLAGYLARPGCAMLLCNVRIFSSQSMQSHVSGRFLSQESSCCLQYLATRQLAGAGYSYHKPGGGAHRCAGGIVAEHCSCEGWHCSPRYTCSDRLTGSSRCSCCIAGCIAKYTSCQVCLGT